MLLVWDRGYPVLDDTAIATPYATAMAGPAWGFPSPERRPGYGPSLAPLVRTDGHRRLPLSLRLWHKGGPSKYELALELRS
jgi:hypothetical protein